jgi:signal transduction histidine kinase
MAESKQRVAAAIAKAQADLEEALYELEKIPAFDVRSVAFGAHALNNYITIIEGTVELILGHLADHPDERIQMWLQGVLHATELMARTLGPMVNVSGTMESALRFEKFDLPPLVRRICEYYQRAAAQKAIAVNVGPALDVPPVRGDRVLVAAVLGNLLSNAIKYSPPGKQVWVQVRGEPSWAVCSVRDDGPGLSREDQARLFQKGARLTSRPTGGEPSTGYGLAVAKEFIEKLGGGIWCESVLGEGACFSIRVPAFQEPPADTGANPSGPPTVG